MSEYWIDNIHVVSPEPVRTAEFYVKMFGTRLLPFTVLAVLSDIVIA